MRIEGNTEDYGRKLIVCVDSFEQKNPVGSLYAPAQGKGLDFGSTIELLEGMEGLMSRMVFAAEDSSDRFFNMPERREWDHSITEGVQKGKRATFVIQLLFRRNVSWQGKLTCAERQWEVSFRSVLELLGLMNNMMQCDK